MKSPQHTGEGFLLHQQKDKMLQVRKTPCVVKPTMLYLNPKMFEIWLTSSIYKAHSNVMVF